MKLALLKILGFSIIISCSNNNSQNAGGPGQSKANGNSAMEECYKFAGVNDTIELQLTHVGDSVSGTLEYRLHEKDRNVGTIKGIIKGNLLVADYTFMSEGVQSERQVAFKKVNNKMIEGYGEVMTTGDKVSFINTDSLQFDSRFALTKTGCKSSN